MPDARWSMMVKSGHVAEAPSGSEFMATSILHRLGDAGIETALIDRGVWSLVMSVAAVAVRWFRRPAALGSEEARRALAELP